ncbi:MAG: hypothetical protein IJY28_02700 [Clostridia bacterium]|nr:hypothetical protein [Clostridia bacterium]
MKEFWKQCKAWLKPGNLILLGLIVVCLLVYKGYQRLDQLWTDRTPPVITVTMPVAEVSVKDADGALLQGITAADETDGDVTSSMIVESVMLLDTTGRAEVRYAAFDRSGNVAKATREVRFTDYTRPEFTLNAPLLYVHGVAFDVLRDLGVQDVVDGDLQHRIKATSVDGESITTQGTHMVQFQVTNSLGDTVKLSLPVEVYAAGAYNARLTLTDYLVYLPKGGTFDAGSYLKEFIVGEEITDLQGGSRSGFTAKISGQPDMQNPGVYAVDYRITWQKNTTSSIRQEYTAYSRLIVIVEG